MQETDAEATTAPATLESEMGDFRKLEVWQRSRRLDKAIYRLSASFPSTERYGLTEQMRKASASIAANIAEGCGRNTDRELARFVSISLGSANELENHLIRSLDLGFIDEAACRPLIEEARRLKRMLAGLIRFLRAKDR